MIVEPRYLHPVILANYNYPIRRVTWTKRGKKPHKYLLIIMDNFFKKTPVISGLAERDSCPVLTVVISEWGLRSACDKTSILYHHLGRWASLSSLLLLGGDGELLPWVLSGSSVTMHLDSLSQKPTHLTHQDCEETLEQSRSVHTSWISLSSGLGFPLFTSFLQLLSTPAQPMWFPSQKLPSLWFPLLVP